MASKEYYDYINSTIWKDKSARFRRYTAGRCGIFPWLKASDAHHLTYDNFRDECYIKDCIPVSRFVHDFIHKNPIGLYFWDDIRGRRRWMNHALRVIVTLVTIGATVSSPAYMFLIRPAYKLYRWHYPKLKAKPKLRRKIKNV